MVAEDTIVFFWGGGVRGNISSFRALGPKYRPLPVQQAAVEGSGFVSGHVKGQVSGPAGE